jgi:hypothetical protein
MVEASIAGSQVDPATAPMLFAAIWSRLDLKSASEIVKDYHHE